ncbi:MAG: 4-alpha-glucanotransferase [Thermodesulfovibrionales bacterium]|jgi:4-alpha-glucanotransferase
MNLSLDLIHALSRLCGIIQGYRDAFGQWQETPAETQWLILRAMGLTVDTDEDLLREIRKRQERDWKRFIDPVRVISVNAQPFSVPLSLPLEEGDEASLRLSWKLMDEKGRCCISSAQAGATTISDQAKIDERRFIRLEIPCQPREADSWPIGYYTLLVSCTGKGLELTGKARIIITPDACYIPPSIEKKRIWGLSLNLYSLSSEGNWGIGDLSDLAGTVRAVAEAGGSFVGINPLHCIANSCPSGISPYSPISRIYRNWIYLDIGKVPDVAESAEAQRLMASAPFMRKLEELKAKKLIDYPGVASMKAKVLRLGFSHFLHKHLLPQSPRGREFEEYISGEGDTLKVHATFMALSLQLGKDWRLWPVEYHDPSGNKVAKFREGRKEDLLFFMYAQWLMDSQLREVSEEARALGMPIGIYNDLAIGSVPGGSDAWMAQDILAGGVDVGAPPDDFSREGQNWGFPPAIPERLRDSGYDYLIRTLRENMQYGGAIRIDHALGIFRLFWIPHGVPSSGGAYVEYPSEEIMRIIALESVRNRTIVIGEDLGTIGDNVREALSRFMMLSYRLLYFERDYPEPSFSAPGRYPEMALCSVTTHDLPTLYGYWRGRDIETRKNMDLYTDEETRLRDISVRERDKALLIGALRAEGLFREEAAMPEEMNLELFIAVYAYLSRSGCKLLSVNLDDAIGTLDQQNLPGQTDLYPCWLQKTPLSLEQILTGPWIPALSSAMEAAGRSFMKR